MSKALGSLLALLFLALQTLHAAGPGKTIIVLDASGSMWGQIEGKAKIEIARETIGGLLKTLDPDLELGLMAYGHRREGDCADIELLIPPAKVDREAFLGVVMEILPRGKTPLTDSVRQAAEFLAYTEEKANVILVSDGIENCGGDICALAEQLEKQGVDFTSHVVAFDLAAKDARTMECLSSKTGGRFLAAQDAAGLKDALEMAVKAVTEAAPPEPPAEEERPPATIEAPAKVTAGKRFEVTWKCEKPAENDFITIVPKDTKEREWGNFTYVSRGNPVEVLAPIQAGPCEVRYLAGRTRETLARVDILVEPVRATVGGPAEVTAGSAFTATWTGPDNAGDYITIVAKDAREGRYGKYAYTKNGKEAELRAPVAAGDYELRYVTGQKAITLARADIRVVAAQATVKARAEAVAGSKVSVEWTGPGNQGDYITIVPKGSGPRVYKSYSYTKGHDSPLEVKAAIEPGDYEVRYVTGQKATVLASAPITLVKAEVAVSAPDEVTAGSPFEAEWTGPGNQGDYITIVKKGAKEGSYNHYAYARTGTPTVTLNAIEEAGDCEVRYVAGQGGKTLAATDIRLTAAAVELKAPAEVVAGGSAEVAWSQAINPRDFITIVMKDAKKGDYGHYVYAKQQSPQEITAPETPGEGEVRYVTGKGKTTLASLPIRILEAKATVSVSPTVAAGQPFEVKWTGPGNARDYLTIVPKGAGNKERGSITYARGKQAGELNAPKEAGDYEVRYMTGKLRKILASQPVTVVAE